MSVIIRLQNLPWSANALDIRNFFRGLSIPEGGVHIVGGELGDAFIAFSTDEDARQAMMLNGGKIKEVQVNLLLSSRSEMHKVIETARQTVPILTLTAPAPAPAPQTLQAPTPVVPSITPFSSALSNNPLASFGIPGIGIPHEIPQPAVIEPPAPLISPNETPLFIEEEDDKAKKRRSKERRGTRSRSRSRSRDRTKDRKRDRRDRSRSRERRRRDRSRSRDRSDRRKRDRNNRSRSRERSPRRSRDRRNERSPQQQPQLQDPINDTDSRITPFSNPQQIATQMQARQMPNGNGPERFIEPAMSEAYSKLEELGKKRNPNAFQGDGRENGRGNTGANKPAPRRTRFEESRDCCVAIRNAPTHTSYGDVRRFFPFMIDKHGIKMINDATGRRTGTIYVRFTDERSRQLTLQRKINELKNAPVTVEPLSDEEYDNAIDSFLPFRADNDNQAIGQPTQPAFSALKLSDLPHYIKEHDIIKIFTEYSLLSIVLDDDKQTRTRIAYVQFAKPEEAVIAFQRKELCVFGRRQATVEPLPEEPEQEAPPAAAPPRDPRQRREPAAAFPPAASPAAPPAPPAGFQFPFVTAPDAPVWGSSSAAPAAAAPADDDDGSLDCVLMKGLPRDATDRSIVTFLADTGAVPARIHLMLDGGGAPTGDCFCEFRSAREARLAAGKHGAELAGRRVTVDLVPRGVVELALDAPPASSLMGPAPPYGDPRAPRPAFHARPAFRGGFDQMAQFEQPRGRSGFSRGGFDLRGGFDQPRGGFNGGRGGFEGGRGGFEGGRGGFEGGRGGFDSGRGGFDNGRGGFEGRGSYRGRSAWVERGLRRGRGARGARGGGAPADNEAALESFGEPGCVVAMENVPFRAAVDDILDFFHEFELSQDDIIRRYNERGQPTGDARVAFRTPYEAQRAVTTKNMTTIFERRVNLALM